MKYSILIILLILFLDVDAKNYYVSKSGSNANTGSFDSPFLTISRASMELNAGDTCFIQKGIYREVIQPQRNGTAANPIVYSNYTNDTVIISATEKIENWDQHSGNIYRAKYKMELERQNMVFCNGEAMDWARWPNNSDNNKYTVEGLKVDGGSGSTILSSYIDGTNWTGGYVWYLGAHSGTSWTRKITASQAGKILFVGVNINKWPFNPHNPTVWRNGNRGQFFIFGNMNALDHENEWFYNASNDSVYFQAPGNGNPNAMNIEIAQRERTMLLEKNYVQINGLHVFGGKAEITGAHCKISNCEFKNCLQILDELDNSDAQVANAPVHVRASNTIIENNIIDGSSLNGVYIQGWSGITQVTLKNNLIKNCNTVGIHASPIRSAATYCKFISNTLHTTGRDGIYCGGSNCEIAYNDVFDCMRINNDGGLFYVVGNAKDKNNEVHHNWFHDSWGPEYADGRCAGIYLDNNSKGYSVHHNVVWNITWTGIQINWDNWNIDIFNNSIYNAQDGAMGRWENGYTIKDLVIKNNYASKGKWIGTDVSTKSNIINSINPFRSVEDKDFRPKRASFLIDNGEVIQGITDGYQGANPDIGAYEDGLTPWKPGVNAVEGGDPDFPVKSISFKLTNGFEVFPNPVNDSWVRVRSTNPSSNKIMSLYQSNGKLIFQKKMPGKEMIIPRETFVNPGLYLIKMDADNQSRTKKLIVK